MVKLKKIYIYLVSINFFYIFYDLIYNLVMMVDNNA